MLLWGPGLFAGRRDDAPAIRCAWFLGAGPLALAGAPLEPLGSIFGPKATVYRGEITFRVRLRDGSAKPADGGANP